MTIAQDHALTSPPARLASGSSFYTAMRILPRAKRDAVMAIYAFCRAVDDIADNVHEDRATRLAELTDWRADLERIYNNATPPQLEWLSQPIEDWGLPKADFLAILDGMEMDVREDIVGPDRATLDLYCDHVASAVGRLTVRVFGMPLHEGHELAHYLGRALQLTNILRDIDEDAAMGRVYLPADALATAGLSPDTAVQNLASTDLTAACAPIVALAQRHYHDARTIMRDRPKEEVRAPAVMAEVYGALLGKLEARGFAAPREPVRLAKTRLLLAFLRNGIL